MLAPPVVLLIFSTVICAERSQQQLDHAEEDQDALADGGGDDRISLVIWANKEFAFRLYRKLAGHAASKGENIIFSPVSVSAALAALSVGARGETHQQLFTGLGFNSSQLAQTDVDQAFCTFIGNMASHEDISQGTAVFVDNLFQPKAEFMHVLKQFYYADSFNVDFTKPTESADTINWYVSGKTNGKINKLVESLDSSMVMYLLSYIYFKGNWETQFNPKQTKPDVFRMDEINEVPVQMMRMEEVVDTYYDQAIATSVLHLPFNNSYSMLLLLPDHMDTLENDISPAHVTKWLECREARKYRIFVPKFSIKTSYKLNDVLTEMGMADMFGDRTDLSGIADGQKLLVSEVVHQATLDVDEAGATAAAATGVGIMDYSLSQTPELKFNRPFMVMIIKCQTNIFFMGKIVNPNL
ncbi:serine protease inhibitor A3M-like [Fundulus diaphanus]